MDTIAPNDAGLDDAARLLALMAPSEPVTFQTFDDSNHHKRELVRVLHGSFSEHETLLRDLNGQGAGVFWMVNCGDNKGRKTSNVERVRALFVDLDGAPLEPVLDAPLPPHCVVESSPGRWHAYWGVSGCELGNFAVLQKGLAARFQSDPKVCDLPRVLRLPGFDHCKGKPFRSRIIEIRALRPYLIAEVIRAFDLRQQGLATSGTSPHECTLPDTIPEGERNTTLFRLAASLARKGFDHLGIECRLQRINGERCTPPLDGDEVAAIAAHAIQYGSAGYVMLAHKLLDSPEWRALSPSAHDIVIMALRRYNGANNGNIALTWTDFKGRKGFKKKDTFYAQRAHVIASGILEVVKEGGNGQTGRKPDLFGIASRWLQAEPKFKK